MKFSLFSIIAVLLSSCVSIYFTEPQPKDGILLTEIPTELHGHWNRENSLLRIESTGVFSCRSSLSDSITNTFNTSDTACEYFILSDSVKLYKIKNTYVLNFREKNNPWELILIERKKNGNIFVYGSTDTEIFSKDKNLTFINANVTLNDKDTIVQTLDPNFTNLDSDSGYSYRLNSVTYAGQMSFKTIKKIAARKNVIRVLRTDGTIN